MSGDREFKKRYSSQFLQGLVIINTKLDASWGYWLLQFTLIGNLIGGPVNNIMYNYRCPYSA